jgi:heme o synthase
LTKPGIIYGNLITAAAGFLFACNHQVYWRLLLETLLGIALVIGAACIFNNVLDRDIDARMTRTRSRALPAGKLSVKQALVLRQF